MSYVDGFVLPLAKKNVPAYRRMARIAAKVWREHGALDYKEWIGEDMATQCGVSFPKIVGAKRGETVVLAWIVYKSRAHRDRVNAKILKDPRMLKMMGTGKLPFDVGRMAYGGFKILVNG